MYKKKKKSWAQMSHFALFKMFWIVKNYTQYSVRKQCMKTNTVANIITLPQNKFSPNFALLEHHLNGACKTIYNGALW